MNPRYVTSSSYGRGFVMVEEAPMSEFDRDLERAKAYFGDNFPGNPGLTCLKCGCAVNLGWQHITWHEAMRP